MLQEKDLMFLNELKQEFPCEQFIITGSIALSLHGLTPTQEKYDDFDIIMAGVSTSTIEKLDLLSRVHKSHKNPSKYETTDMYRFNYKGTDVDVWLEPKRNNLLQYKGIFVSGIKEIIDAKKRFNRSKDWLQINEMAILLLTPLPIKYTVVDLQSLPMRYAVPGDIRITED